MSNKFDELANGLTRSVTRTLLCLAVTALSAGSMCANDFRRGPLVQVSDPNPLAGCDDGLRPPGVNSFDAQPEPCVAVNPANPKNIVAAWISGEAQGIIAGVSLDGGKRWQQVVIPGLTLCSGGTFRGATDPWISFAPNGEVYVISMGFSPFPHRAIFVDRKSVV